MSTSKHRQIHRKTSHTFPAWMSMSVTVTIMAFLVTVRADTDNNGLAADRISTSGGSSGSQHPPDSLLVAQLRVPQCREHCIDKFSIDDMACMQTAECSSCWTRCQPPSSAISASAAASTVVEASAARMDRIRLDVVSMVRDGVLTSVEVGWQSSANTPSQCLVTWEVAGGGLMGNLLTDTQDVQLTLWPDSRYRVQVTCKNKISSVMSKSPTLTIDTSKAILRQFNSMITTSSKSPATTTAPHPASLVINASIPSIHPSKSEATTHHHDETPPDDEGAADYRVLLAHRQRHVQPPDSDPALESAAVDADSSITPLKPPTISTITTHLPSTTSRHTTLMAIAASCALMMVIVYCMLPIDGIISVQHKRHKKAAAPGSASSDLTKMQPTITSTASTTCWCAKTHLLSLACSTCRLSSSSRPAVMVEGTISRVDMQMMGGDGDGGCCAGDATLMMLMDGSDGRETSLRQIIHL